MEKKHRQHLKTRTCPPFNLHTKEQEDAAKIASNTVWKEINKKYSYKFDNLKTLGRTDIDAAFALNYMNRGLRLSGLPERELTNLQSIDSAGGIKPDGGVFFVTAKDGFKHIIVTLEVKHQGEYDGYTPKSDSEWKKKNGDLMIRRADRPPQAQGNAIERFAKNSNAIRTLTSCYGYNPYVMFGDGFDCFLKEDYPIFENQRYSGRFKEKDSSILMRLIAGNDYMRLNEIYVTGIKYGKYGASELYPATIFARMPKWTSDEIATIELTVIDRVLEHLKSIDEL